jgi:hypothetical protein
MNSCSLRAHSTDGSIGRSVRPVTGMTATAPEVSDRTRPARGARDRSQHTLVLCPRQWRNATDWARAEYNRPTPCAGSRSPAAALDSHASARSGVHARRWSPPTELPGRTRPAEPTSAASPARSRSSPRSKRSLPIRLVLAPVLSHHPHRPLPHLWCEPARSSHGPSFPRNSGSGEGRGDSYRRKDSPLQ